MPLLAAVKAKLAAFVALLHRLSTHTVTAVYLLLAVAIVVPLCDWLWHYWKPSVVAFQEKIAGPAVAPPKMKGKL